MFSVINYTLDLPDIETRNTSALDIFFEKLMRYKSSSYEKGFSLIEILVVIAIVGILSAIAIQQLAQHKSRAYDSDAKASLHNIYLACKAYWAEASSTVNCGLTEAVGTRYGFIQSTHIIVSATSSAETVFTATAQHSSSSNVFAIDANGNIS